MLSSAAEDNGMEKENTVMEKENTIIKEIQWKTNILETFDHVRKSIGPSGSQFFAKSHHKFCLHWVAICIYVKTTHKPEFSYIICLNIPAQHDVHLRCQP